jgi:hypothetical protein
MVTLVNIYAAWMIVMNGRLRETPWMHKYREATNGSNYDDSCMLRRFRFGAYTSSGCLIFAELSVFPCSVTYEINEAYKVVLYYAGWCTVPVRRSQQVVITWKCYERAFPTITIENSVRQRRGRSGPSVWAILHPAGAVQTETPRHDHKDSHWRMGPAVWASADCFTYLVF